jgi:hypothetical protein
MQKQRIVLKAFVCYEVFERIFLHLSPPFPGFIASSEKIAGLCRIQAVSNRRSPAPNVGQYEAT